jgi:hypothetical protein
MAGPRADLAGVRICCMCRSMLPRDKDLHEGNEAEIIYGLDSVEYGVS